MRRKIKRFITKNQLNTEETVMQKMSEEKAIRHLISLLGCYDNVL